MTSLILLLLQLFLFILMGRAILSWFPVRPGGVAASINGVLFTLTEPVLRPVRRIVPRTGMIDLSFIIVFFGIVVLRGIIASA